jgi:ribose transport system ATP-binding protein
MDEQGSAKRPLAAQGGTPVLAAYGISKSFAGRTVLRDFDLEVQAGEVHGILGENGSGKSTFIKVLSGYLAPEPGGELLIRGRPAKLPLKVTDPAALGIGFVHQDLALFESGTVMENVRIGRYETALGWRVPWRRERRTVRRLLDEFGLDIDPGTLVARLGPIERAMIAIVRALDQLHGDEQSVLVLDEPTCYLPKDGVERLFAAVREVAARGIGVVFVTHSLEEVSAITDRVTVLRDGARVLTAPTSELTEDRLVEAILGFALTDLYPTPHASAGAPLIEARGVSGALVKGVDLSVRSGEIVGVTGLAGMGFDELPYLLFGSSDEARGTLTIAGAAHDLQDLDPRGAMRAGLALLPANRLRDAGVAAATAAENLTFLTLSRFFDSGRLRHRREREHSRALMDEFDVRPRTPQQRFASFSGGNQQKLVLAKWLARNPPVLLLHEPTQGVDIGARKDIFAKIRAAADQGSAVLIASAEYEDLANLCDRVLVVRRGKVVGELAGERLTHERILDQVLRDRAGAGVNTPVTSEVK